MFCHACGKSIHDDAQFCNHCGATQNSKASSSSNTTTSANLYVPPAQMQAANELSIGKVVSDSFADLKANYLVHLVSTLLAVVIGNFTFGLLLGPLQVGYMKLEQNVAAGRPASIGDIFKGFDHFVPALVAFIICVIVIVIGSFLCIIPGLFLAPLLPVSLYLVARGETDGVQAVQRAWGHMKGNLLMAMITMLVLSILGSLGAILCFVGIVFTLPLFYIGAYHMAKQLVGDAAPATNQA